MTSTATTGTTYPSVDMNRGEFHNEPFIDFSQPDNRKAMEAAMALVKGMFGRDYPLTIGGQRITTTEKIHSHNPSHPDQVVGIFQKATVEMANKAVENAHTAFERWKRVPVEERVACVYRTADILRKRRYELDAWLSYEIG
ncbi:MAG: aldehyde dehydrogenase family protein, partial [Candidatus Acidiferrales bacterium]